MSNRTPLPPLPPCVELVDITPALAAEWLEKYNTHNRPFRTRSVNAYARDMVNGRWTFTGDTIKRAADGTILDGQNRLAAIVKADVTVRMLVVVGVELEAQQNMDAQAKRTHADNLHLRGEKNYATLAAATRLCVLYTQGRLTPSGGGDGMLVTNSEINDWIEANPYIRDAVDSAVSWKTKIDAPPTVTAAAFFFLSEIDTGDAIRFFENLASRVGLEFGDPVLALDSRLREIRRNSTRASQHQYLALFMKAWNYWRAGKPVRTLRLKSNAGIPEPK